VAKHPHVVAQHVEIDGPGWWFQAVETTGAETRRIRSAGRNSSTGSAGDGGSSEATWSRWRRPLRSRRLAVIAHDASAECVALFGALLRDDPDSPAAIAGHRDLVAGSTPLPHRPISHCPSRDGVGPRHRALNTSRTSGRDTSTVAGALYSENTFEVCDAEHAAGAPVPLDAIIETCAGREHHQH
jgi:hypothetical protein